MGAVPRCTTEKLHAVSEMHAVLHEVVSGFMGVRVDRCPGVSRLVPLFLR